MACEVESLAVACTSFTDHTASFMPVTGRHEPTERPSSSSPITKHEHHELVNNLKWEREEAYHLTSTVLLRHTPRTSGRSNVFSAMQYDIGQFHTRTRPKYCTGQEAIGKDSGASIFQLIGFCVYTHGQTRGSDKFKKCQLCRDSDHDYSVGCNRHCLKPDIIATLLVSSYNLLLD